MGAQATSTEVPANPGKLSRPIYLGLPLDLALVIAVTPRLAQPALRAGVQSVVMRALRHGTMVLRKRRDAGCNP